jgi:hypothetical protein
MINGFGITTLAAQAAYWFDFIYSNSSDSGYPVMLRNLYLSGRVTGVWYGRLLISIGGRVHELMFGLSVRKVAVILRPDGVGL